MKTVKLFFPLFLFLILSCQKEEQLSYIQRTFQGLYERLELDCIEGDDNKAFLSAMFGSEEVCYYDGVDERELRFSITSIFTTPGPEFNTGDIPDDLRRGARLNISRSPLQQDENFLRINFPNYTFGRDTLDYLDSLFNIEFHPISGIEDDDYKFKIEFKMVNFSDNGNGLSFTYSMSTIFGPQDSSFVQIVKAKKIRDTGGTYYDLELAFECDLYFWPQYGVNGLWKEVREGVFKGRIHATRR